MRTIKFRGKRLDNGEWVVGRYAKALWELPEVVEMDVIITRVGSYEVLPESVGQWTGRTDKNGAELYEGDVVKILAYYYDYDGSKYWMKDECRLGRVTFQDGGFYLGAIPLTHFSADEYEIIHDNPELVEVE